MEAEMYYYIINSDSIMSRFRSNKVVENNYIGLPKAWRFAAESMDGISEDLAVWSISRATMYYQTVLRKLNTPDTGFVQEAISYVKQHKNTLLRYRWGIKYYISALVLCACYPLWSKIFRRGID